MSLPSRTINKTSLKYFGKQTIYSDPPDDVLQNDIQDV